MSRQDWFFPKISDYWDWTDNAVEQFSSIIAMASPALRAAHLKDISDAMTEHVAMLPDRTLLDVLMVMVEDLYKELNRTLSAGGALFQYLEASAGTLITLAAQRKCVVRYLVDNIFEYTEFGMMRPLTFFRDSFCSAGLVYVCPQETALMLMQADQKDPQLYFQLLPQYIAEANFVADKVVEGCHSESRSYVFVNADNSPDPFDFKCALAAAGAPGVVTVVRREAPVAGSNCYVIYPQVLDPNSGRA